MKTCPSCGSELADDAKECLCGYSYETEPTLDDEAVEGVSEMELEPEELVLSAPEPSSGGPPPTKSCVFCLSEIASPAIRCPHCSGFLPIAEGSIFKQYFFFLVASLGIAIGCLLPWERSYQVFNLTGADSIAGGFLLLFATYGVIASFFNIYHRKMIVWPVLLAAIDGTIFGVSRIVSIEKATHLVLKPASKFGLLVERVRGHLQVIGPGLYLVVLFSVLVLLSVVLSVFMGARQDAKRKEIEREARAVARKSRRS